MGVEDNKFDISDLTESQTFLEWFNKTNDEIIDKLNRLEVFDGASGDGIDVSVGTTLGGGTSGVMLVQMSGNVTRGVTFADITVTDSLNYSFDGSEIKAITQFTGVTSGFTFANVVRADYTGNSLGITLAKANIANNAEAIGFVNSVSGSKVNVLTHGKISGDFTTIAGGTLSSGCVYFLDPANAGKITTTEPSVVGQVSKPILIGITGDTGIVINYRGQEVGFSGGTGSGIGSLRVIVPVTDASTFTVGTFISKNLDPNISFADDGGSPRTADSGVFPASANDPYYNDTTRSPKRTDLLGVITEKNTTDNTLEVLVRGYLPKATLNVTSLTSSPFYLTKGHDGKPVDEKTDVLLGHLVDSDVVFIDPKINESDFFQSLTDRLFLDSGGISFGVQSTDTVINGSYDIWQRQIGTDSEFTGNSLSDSLYFADRWVFLNGVSSGSPVSGGTFGIQRKAFTAGQEDVRGEPTYYARVTNNYTGLSGAIDDIHIENRLESSEVFLGEDSVISIYTKSPAAGSTIGVFFKQYFDNGMGVSGDSTTTKVGDIELGSNWSASALSFTVPGLTGSQTITGTDHYSAIAFDITGVTGNHIDFAQLQFELGTNPTAPVKKDKKLVLDECRKFYQRSYDEETATRASTMTETTIPDLTVVDVPVNYSKDYYYNFPVKMRTTPAVTLYSPNTGVTADGYNRLAELDMRLTSGTIGPNGQTRVSRVNQPTIQVGNTGDSGIRFEIVSGAVVGDQVSVHYVADADINKNL